MLKNIDSNREINVGGGSYTISSTLSINEIINTKEHSFIFDQNTIIKENRNENVQISQDAMFSTFIHITVSNNTQGVNDDLMEYSFLHPYFPQDGVSGSSYSEGGSLFALGPIHANHGFPAGVIDSSDNSSTSITQ
ncbi:5591_t:CDS:2, partial [Funneliformis geosporum]